MNIEVLVQQLLNGLQYGFIYALASSGLALLYGVLEVINFSHGELIMVGGYLLFFFALQVDFFLAILIVAIVMFLIGFVVNRTIFVPATKISWSAPLLATLGLSLALKNTVLLIFGARPKWIPSPLSEMVLNIGGIKSNMLYVAAPVVTIGAFLFLNFFVTKTKTGKAMRAISQNRWLCDVLGMNVVRVFDITVAISLLMAGLGGVLYCSIFGVFPNIGAWLGVKVFSIVVISGFKNVKGAIIVALLAGIVESTVAAYFSMQAKDIFLFLFAALIASIKPEGLFGKKVGIW